MNETIVSEDLKNEILDAVNKNECEFDVDTVRAYLELSKKSKFAMYLKQDRQRVEQYYNARFQSFINQVKVKAMENELDPGFN